MYNKVIMIGNLTRDIELKYLPSGSAIAASSIATSHKYKMQDGTQKEEVCFLEFSVFGKQGEVLNQYVRKGSKVMLEGRLIFEQWQAQDGSKRSRHTLRVEQFKFLDSKADSANGGNNYNAPQQQQPYGQNQSSQNSYNNQQQYNQPQQNSYNSQVSQQGGMNQASQQNSYEQNIPTIDIDNDEIPF
ncbi:MAG: single-stranded DNA-binding protein [Campylobacterota bacterium]|nr:single-stranded DNA-binding protein [Campylobacterota bacterium]